MDKGFRPDEILAASREERLLYMAIAELNEEQLKNNMQEAILKAIAEILTILKK